MTQDPDTLRELVDRKADDLKRDLEELGDRLVVQPKAAIQQKAATVRKVYDPMRSLAQKHPIATGAGAAALGFALGFTL